MHKVKILKIRFQSEIEAYEIPAFRGAVIAKAGHEHILFHNHLNDRELLYGYPVIQYKRIGRNPALISIDYGLDEIKHVFLQENMEIQIGQRPLTLEIKDLHLQTHSVSITSQLQSYRLYNWLALNQENYAEFKKLRDPISQTQFLENILVGNILSFGKGIKWSIEQDIVLRIDSLLKQKVVPYKQQKLVAFDIQFRCNAQLPPFIGLGKGVSLGFGTVSTLK